MLMKVGMKKLKVHGLADGGNQTVISFDVLPVCDRRTDERTDGLSATETYVV